MRNPKLSLRLRLVDILNGIGIARAAVGDLSVQALQADAIRRSAAERAIEIISEASRHIPAESKARFDQLPWSDIASIGNILRHGYDIVDAEIIWKITKDDLASLESAVRELLASLETG
jgi:uncharacterized protein with HEPN domain